jgi:hypothetical protein
MGDLPKPRRKPLKVYPEPEAMLEELVRSLQRIANGLESVVVMVDAVVTEDDHGRKCLRTDRP